MLPNKYLPSMYKGCNSFVMTYVAVKCLTRHCNFRNKIVVTVEASVLNNLDIHIFSKKYFVIVWSLLLLQCYMKTVDQANFCITPHFFSS